jgi:hypothetical protein
MPSLRVSKAISIMASTQIMAVKAVIELADAELVTG